jgi:hypothetical protein
MTYEQALLAAVVALGGVIAFLGRWILSRYDKDMESRMSLAQALNGLSQIIDRIAK